MGEAREHIMNFKVTSEEMVYLITFKGLRKRKVAGNTKAAALRYQREQENQLERDKGASTGMDRY